MEKSTVGFYFASASADAGLHRRFSCRRCSACSRGSTSPPGQERYTIKDSFTLPDRRDARSSVGAHAHYLGKEMKLTATFPDGTVAARCCGSRTGTSRGRSATASRTSWRCRRARGSTSMISYDNSAANRRNPSRPPVRVTWGEESNDEMGSVGLQVVAATSRRAAGAAAGVQRRTCARPRQHGLGSSSFFSGEPSDCTRLHLSYAPRRRGDAEGLIS